MRGGGGGGGGGEGRRYSIHESTNGECTVREINPFFKFNSESEVFTAATDEFLC